MKKKRSTRKDTRRRRVTWVIVQGVLIYVMCFFPASRWSTRPMIPMFMAAVFTVLATAKSKSVKSGFWRGLIFGILAGMATWGGMDYTARQESDECRAVINFDYDVYLKEVEQAKADARIAAEEGKISAEKLAEIENFAPPEPFTEENVANAQIKLDELTAWRDTVPFYTIPPMILVCSCIGLYFGARSQQRRKRTEGQWHTI